MYRYIAVSGRTPYPGRGRYVPTDMLCFSIQYLPAECKQFGGFSGKKARPAGGKPQAERAAVTGRDPQLQQEQNRIRSRIRIQIHSLFSKMLQKHPIFYPFSDMPERICSIDFTGIGTAAQRGFSLLPGVPDCRSSWCAALLTEYAGRGKGLREYSQVRSRRSQFSRKSLAAVRLPMGISTEAAQFLQVTRIISCRMSTTYSPSPSGQWQ